VAYFHGLYLQECHQILKMKNQEKSLYALDRGKGKVTTGKDDQNVLHNKGQHSKGKLPEPYMLSWERGN